MRQFAWGAARTIGLSPYPRGLIRLAAALSMLAALSGCQRNIVPSSLAEERLKSESAGAGYALPWAEREVPDLASDGSLARALEYAFLSNGDLEASFLDWRAAIEKVPQAGALPDPRLDFQFLFMPGLASGDTLGSFASLAAGLLDSIRVMGSQEIPAKGKRKVRAEQALAEAGAAAERFRSAKLRVQREVTQAYARLALSHDLIGNTSDTLRLLNQARAITLQQYRHSVEMKSTADVQRAELEIDRAASDQRALAIEQSSILAELNGLLGREPGQPIEGIAWPESPPDLPDLPSLLALAAERNPELAEMRKEIEAKGAAQTLAELERKSDFMLAGGLDDPLVPVLSAGITLPLNREKIRAGIAEAFAARQAADARLRGGEFGVKTRVAAALAGIANADRLLADTTDMLIPKAESILRTQELQYGSGGGSYFELLDTQRVLLDLRRLLLRGRADRFIHLAALEEIVDEDLLQRNAAAGRPQTEAQP